MRVMPIVVAPTTNNREDQPMSDKEQNISPKITPVELASAIATIENDISTFSKAIVTDTNLELAPSNIRDAILSVLTIISGYSTTASLLKLYLLSLEGITALASYVEPKNFTNLEHYSKKEFYVYLIENLDVLWPLYLQNYLVSLF